MVNNETERFDALAERFHRETGYIVPGKDVAAASAGDPDQSYEARLVAWCVWRKCCAAAQPEAPAGLREAVGRVCKEIKTIQIQDDPDHVPPPTIRALAEMILSAVEPVMEAREKLLREALDKRIDDDWLKRVRALVGGKHD